MTQYIQLPIMIEATQWFKNGDHPMDSIHTPSDWEGDLVRYYRNPDDRGNRVCEMCGKIMHHHGWIDAWEGGYTVCPGDFIITDEDGEHYPCKPDRFHNTHELAALEKYTS